MMRNKAQSSVNVTLGERQPQEALTELPTSQNFDQNNDSANQNGASNEDDIPAELMELLKNIIKRYSKLQSLLRCGWSGALLAALGCRCYYLFSLPAKGQTHARHPLQ